MTPSFFSLLRTERTETLTNVSLAFFGHNMRLRYAYIINSPHVRMFQRVALKSRILLIGLYVTIS